MKIKGPIRALGAMSGTSLDGIDGAVLVTDGETITVSDLHGEILIEHTRPAPAVTYVGNRRPPRPAPGPRTVTNVLTHQVSPKS